MIQLNIKKSAPNPGDEFYIEEENPSKDKFDRYRNCSLLKDKDTGEVLLSTRELIDIPRHVTDRIHRVEAHEQCRFDILANKYYRNPLLWWVIAEANEVTNPLEDIPAGSLVRIPDLETLYGNRGILL